MILESLDEIKASAGKAQPLDVSRFDVPEWARWIAADSSGGVYPYSTEPVRGNHSWVGLEREIFTGINRNIGSIDMSGIDWRQTLTPVNQAGRHTMAITTDSEPTDDAVKCLLGASTQSHGTLRSEPGVIIGDVKVVTPSASPDPVTLFVTLWQRQSPDSRTATARKLVAALGTDAALNLCAEIDDAVVVAQAADIEADDKVMEESNYRAVWGDGDFVIRQRVWSERYGVGTITDIERERPAFYGELTIYYVEFDRGFEAPMLKRELLHYPVATVPADEADALLAQAGAVV